MKDAEAAGKYYLGISHSTATDRAAARYGYATALLAGQGRVQFALHTDYTNEHWFEEYDYAIGSPAAAETRDASGVHRRKFTNGLVLRQPDGERGQGRLRRSLHRLRAHERDGTTLQARSAVVLTRQVMAPLSGRPGEPGRPRRRRSRPEPAGQGPAQTAGSDPAADRRADAPPPASDARPRGRQGHAAPGARAAAAR